MADRWVRGVGVGMVGVGMVGVGMVGVFFFSRTASGIAQEGIRVRK